MTHRPSGSLALMVLLAFSVVLVAYANVAFDFQTGLGRVDAADLQDAFGLNRGQLQKRASQVSFAAIETRKIAVLCDSGVTREAVMEQSASVESALSPAKGSFDGFDLQGLSNIVIADPPPANQVCNGPGHFGATTEVVRRLYARLGGTNVLLLEDH